MSRVVVVKHKAAISVQLLTVDQYRRLIEIGLQRLAGQDETWIAVRQFLPDGPVGMKTNCLARQFNSTPVPLVDGLCSVLRDARFEENELVIWERTSRELAEAGFNLNASSRGVRCLGTDANGVGYERSFHTSGEVSSLISRILTAEVEVNINLPVLKDHSIAGMSAGLKNMYGAIHNPNKFHDDNCDPFCAHVNNLEPLRVKNRLTILDAVRVQYDGGPGYMSQYLATFGGLVISDDPVAVDRVGLEILERIRSDHGRPTLAVAGREVRYLKSAQTLNLGQAELDDIELVVLNVDVDGQASVGELFG
jgi:uncharacterized protein (DUF362 family)